jgi:Flp pilus assembly pilin Flp
VGTALARFKIRLIAEPPYCDVQILAGLIDRANAQDLVEYGLIVATIAIVVLIAATAFGHQIEPWFEHLSARITTTGT